MQVGMNEMPFTRQGILHLESIPQTGRGFPMVTLQDRQRISKLPILHVQQAGDPGCIVGAVRFKFPGPQSLFEGKSLLQSLIDRVCLVPVCDNRVVSQHPHRGINDQAGILQLGRVKSLGTDPFPVLHKYPVAAVCTAPHDKIGGHSIFAAA